MKSKLTLLLLLIILVVSGCSCEASFTTANYKDLKMARLEGEEAVYTDTFKSDIPEIFVTGVLDNAPGDTELKSEWYYMEGDEEFIDSATLETEEGKTEIHFSLTRPNEGWPDGSYEVRLFIDDEHQETLEFEVEGAKANYRDLAMAKSVNEEPVYTDVFATDTPVIYATGIIENVAEPIIAKAEWYYTENKEEFIDSAELELEEETDFYFSLSSPDDGWPKGSYEVRLFINDELQETVEFKVE
ncbi:MAG: hypothetical protein ACLFPS_05250 [Clostridia bacterium]